MASNKITTDRYAGVGPEGGSWWNTINPVANLTGKGGIRVPERVWDFFTKGKTPGTKGYDSAGRWAGIASNMGGAALLGAAILGGYRVAKGIYKDITGYGRDVLKDGENRLNTTYSPEGEEFHKKANKKPVVVAGNVFQSMAQTALPMSAFLLAGAAAYVKADRTMDKAYSYRLDENIEKERQRFNNLVIARARGTKELPVAKTASMNKEAGIFSKAIDLGLTSYGILAAALFGSSALMSYAGYKMNNKNNLNFEAHKKALDSHILNRSTNTPLSYANITDSPILNAIDAGTGTEKGTIRDIPEVTTQSKRRAILD